MSVVIWSAGKLRGEGEAVATAVDHGLTVGDGVFETCGIAQGQAFALTRHLRRLHRSATGLGLAAPDEDEIRAGVAAVLAAGGLGLGRIRITVTGGPGPLGSNRAAAGSVPQTVLVLGGPAARASTVRLVRVPWVRNERSAVAGLKTTSYVENVVVLARAVAQGADEALLANTVGELCEGTGSNVFVERGGELVTPALGSGCLAGITRELLLEWAGAAGLPVREATPGELPYGVLDEVSAGTARVAITSSVRNVVPAVSLDGVAVVPGELCVAAQRLFDARVGEQIDP
ncbi:aminotransferase class IV [Pengzhenrongella sicca]|uniref:Aminotransferase class IV n=1 Tax=Pengzhenrongella sicca TaxID=2819238 RepID=A0A8A4ZAZ2_9MICO|nr:aminotransferase class IV [Pengzhenrongella sicca]QTE28053.1 aminotransferase class IV [Pengzhenrongella sicca]